MGSLEGGFVSLFIIKHANTFVGCMLAVLKPVLWAFFSGSSVMCMMVSIVLVDSFTGSFVGRFLDSFG